MTGHTGSGVRIGLSMRTASAGRASISMPSRPGFAAYVGGRATTIAGGTARPGLRGAPMTRVGHEAMGRFLRGAPIRYGGDVTHIATDPVRLTGLVASGLRDPATFPHIFHRESRADTALDEDGTDAVSSPAHGPSSSPPGMSRGRASDGSASGRRARPAFACASTPTVALSFGALPDMARAKAASSRRTP